MKYMIKYDERGGNREQDSPPEETKSSKKRRRLQRRFVSEEGREQRRFHSPSRQRENLGRWFEEDGGVPRNGRSRVRSRGLGDGRRREVRLTTEMVRIKEEDEEEERDDEGRREYRRRRRRSGFSRRTSFRRSPATGRASWAPPALAARSPGNEYHWSGRGELRGFIERKGKIENYNHYDDNYDDVYCPIGRRRRKDRRRGAVTQRRGTGGHRRTHHHDDDDDDYHQHQQYQQQHHNHHHY